MNTKNKILLALQPPLWGAFVWLLLGAEHDYDWWISFLILLAVFTAMAILLQIVRHRRKNHRATIPRTPARQSAFTLIELMVVIAIIGVLAALAMPVFSHFRKGDSTLAATRQMLDDVGRARQLAISQRTTVYMVFIHTNFWQDPFKLRVLHFSGWQTLQTFAPKMATSTTVTQLYGAQLSGYYLSTLRSVGDQPGVKHPRDVMSVRTLPADSFFAPAKFSPSDTTFTIAGYQIHGFMRTNTLPFPTSDVITNAAFTSQVSDEQVINRRHYVTVSYLAFNYLGQLTPGDGSLLPYDEYIPLVHGSISYGSQPGQRGPEWTETPPGNSTNISYNLIHIDRLTGRARLERAEVL